MISDDAKLLHDYTATRSETAFAELAKRYVDFVYSSAQRQVRDAHLADDVTQAVFLVLASKAKSVPTDRPMSSWLFKVTSYCAANARRARAHRETHERRAAEMAPKMTGNDPEWESFSPLLDEGLSKLRQADRDALLLKFFEKKSLQQVGEALGVSEDAAQKRVTRAIEKLRDFFARRGATISSAALSSELFSRTIQSAPASVAKAVQIPSAGASSAAAIAKGAIILMTAKQTTGVVIVAAILLLGIGGAVVVVSHLSALPSPQQFASTKPAASLTSSSTALTFPIQFNDGSVLEVLGICDPSATPPKWWTANGLPAPAPNLHGLGGASVSAIPGTEDRQIVLRLTGDVKGETLALRLTPHLPMAAGTTNDGKTMILNCVAAIPANSATTVMAIGLASGPWEENESFPVATSQPANAGANPGRVGEVKADGNQTVANIQIIRNNDRDERVVAEQLDGKQVPFTVLNTGILQNGTYKFPCRKETVARIVILSRPYEWVEMNNVALRGDGEPTSIQVNRVSAPADPRKL